VAIPVEPSTRALVGRYQRRRLSPDTSGFVELNCAE
jgi:hypothetical protein